MSDKKPELKVVTEDGQDAADRNPSMIVLGDLEPGEMAQLQGLRQMSDQAVYNVGRHAIAMLKAYDQIRVYEQQAEGFLRFVGQRLGIPEGTPWSVTQKGQAIQMGPVPQKPEEAPEE